jgi:golgin subfamily B member 1
MNDDTDRGSDPALGLVVPKRRTDALVASGDGAGRVEALLQHLERTNEPVARAKILVEIAITMRDDLGDREQALDALLEAWRADPTNEAILDHLEPLARSEDRWAEILETTRTLAGSEREPARSLAYHEAMVRWLTRESSEPQLARQWVERIRVIDPTHALVHFMQAALSREHGDFKREIDELDLAVLSTRRKDDRVRIHLILASRYLEERTFNRAAAKKQFEQAHRLFPRMMEPLRGLEVLAQDDNVALADVLRRQAEADVDEVERASILKRLAKIEEAEFRRPELAAKTLERLLVRNPQMLEEVIDDLERCYRTARMWPELLALLERAVVADTDPSVRADRLKRLSDVLASKLGDVRAALATYQRLAGTMPDDETVLSELARLAEKVSDVPLAVKCRERLAEIVQEPALRARHNMIAGQLVTPIDPAAARRFFERAASADPSNTSAWNALLWDARAENDHARAARYLEDRARRTELPRARAACFVELAELRARLGEAHLEREAWEQAIAADPTNEAAAAALLQPYLLEERYEEAEPLVEVVIAAAERDRDVTKAFAARRAQTRIAFALGRPDLALGAALAAFEHRREDPEARRDLVRAANDMRADPLVLEARDALVALAERREGLDAAARVSLGDVLALMGETDRAAVLYDEALLEKPDDERALAGLSQYHAASGNKIASLALKRQRALAIADPTERLGVLLETADAFARIEQTGLAAEVYEDARQLAPKDLSILYKLLGLYQNDRRWVNVFEVLRAIAEADADPHRRAKTLFTMGQIANRELLDRGTALELFDRTLDVDPSQLEAFERIARILTETRDWAGLEQMYKKMIARSAGDDGLVALLEKQLGLVYRDRLGERQLAIDALQRAVRLRPNDEEAQAILRELMARAGQTSGAVAITFDRIRTDALDPRPYPALLDLLLRENSRDNAVRVASVMTFLDIAHKAAKELRRSYPPPAIEAIPDALGSGGYEELLHPELDPMLTRIFETIVPAVIELSLSRLSLRERLQHPGPSLKGQDWLANAVSRASKILGVPAPKVYARRTPGTALGIAATKPPSLVVYPPALAGVGREVLAFMIGKRIVEATPPLVVRALCPSLSELKSLVATAARIATDKPEPSDLALREKLKRDEIARLREAVEASMSQGGKLDVLRWSQLADLSASQAGLLLAGDVEAARMAIALEPQAPTDLNPREKLRALVGWFLGDACTAFRRRLGVAIG